MARIFSGPQRRELKRLTKIIVEIDNFIKTKSAEGLKYPKEGKKSHEDFLEYISIYFEEKNLLERMTPSQAMQGMRMALNDSREEIRDLLPEEQVEIKRIILEKYGVDLDLMTTRDRKRVREVIKRGTVQSAEEYRLLENHLAMISNSEDLTEASQLPTEVRKIFEVMKSVNKPFLND